MPAIASLEDLKSAQKPLRYALCATCPPKQSKLRRRMRYAFLNSLLLTPCTLRYFMDTRAIEGGDWAVNSVGLTPSVATRAI